MINKKPQYKTMLEHYLLCFNDECALVDSFLHYWEYGTSKIPTDHSISLWKKQKFRFIQISV